MGPGQQPEQEELQVAHVAGARQPFYADFRHVRFRRRDIGFNRQLRELGHGGVRDFITHLVSVLFRHILAYPHLRNGFQFSRIACVRGTTLIPDSHYAEKF